MEFYGIHLTTILQAAHEISLHDMSLKITILKLRPHLPGANELTSALEDNIIAPHYWSFVRGITMLHYCWVPLKRPVMGRVSIIARFMGPAWGPSGATRIQSCPMLAPWTLLSGVSMSRWEHEKMKNELSSETNSEGIFETHQPSLVMHNSLNFTLGSNFIKSNGNMSYM